MKLYKKFLLTIFTSFSCLAVFAIPAKLELRTVTQPDGSSINIRVVGDEYLHFTITDDGYILTQDADGFYRLASIDTEGMIVSTGLLPDKRITAGTNIADIDTEAIRTLREAAGKAPGMGVKNRLSSYPTSGSPRIPVFLVEYSDVKFSKDFDVKEYFTKMMTQEDFDMFGGTGSATQYFRDQSQGKFIPQFDIYGPVTLPETQDYYGNNYGQGWDMKAHYMVSHAAKILDPDVDFSQYDADKDGDVDFIYVFYAGQGEHNKGGENTVWPHAGNLKQTADFVFIDNVWLNRYACSNEMEGDIPNGLGPFVHEYSHILGLSDLYAAPEVVTDRDFTPGPYSVMDYGCYNNDSRTPPNYSAYERNELMWNTGITLDGPMNVTLDEISTGEFGIIKIVPYTEYYLFENRQQTGWDFALPAHGMVVWHVDIYKNYGSTLNSDRDHQSVDLIEANGIPGFLQYAADFTFPGTTGKTEFTSETKPALLTSAGEAIDLPITDIAESEEGVISFKVAGGVPEDPDDIETGIDSVSGENEVPVYYDLQGLKIDNPRRGSIVIEKRGAKTGKIRF